MEVCVHDILLPGHEDARSYVSLIASRQYLLIRRFQCKIVSKGRRIYLYANGTPLKNLELEVVTNDLTRLTQGLRNKSNDEAKSAKCAPPLPTHPGTRQSREPGRNLHVTNSRNASSGSEYVSVTVF